VRSFRGEGGEVAGILAYRYLGAYMRSIFTAERGDRKKHISPRSSRYAWGFVKELSRRF